MSVVYSTESLTPKLCLAMDKIIADYYTWSVPRGLNDGIPVYSFDWEVFYKTEQQGMLVVTTARDESELVGFTLYLVVQAPHHDDVIMAECDSIFVAVDQQGKGIGKKLLQHATDVLQTLGVKWMTNRHRTRTNTKPVFEDLGFTVWETVYMKELN
ncbi:NAT_SF domain containing protein [uncultured Caudovirales phage]|uniref:NAT_SF domain containing protein n=1 Tax=uncultured Caudovirales phage TaxID=2100421 RepID=A0A6J5MX86_9CAUD|nr:NAT_SF domain containing protein [uncultured Caudovirales phage]